MGESVIMKRTIRQSGSTLLWMIGALVVLGAVAAGVALMSPSAINQELANNRHQQSYYVALSGINFAKSLTETQLITVDSKTYSIGSGEFTLKVGDKSGTTYPVSSLGSINKGKYGESYYYIGSINITPVAENNIRPTGPTGSISGKEVHIAGIVDGPVIAQISTLSGGSKITGSYILTSTTQELVITGGVTVAVNNGSVVCSNKGVSISGGSSVINGNVYSPGAASSGNGYIKISGGATVNGNLYANNTITLDGASRIYGQSHSQKDIQVVSSIIGTSSKKQNLLSVLTPTIDGWQTIYTDINSQQGIYLKGITLNGNLHYKTLLQTTQYATTWVGSQDHSPTYPTEPLSCDSFDIFTAPKFSATEDKVIRADTTISAGTYYYKSLTTESWPTICLDTSGGDINILVRGRAYIGGKVYIKSKAAEKCKQFDISSSAAAAAAPYIYLYSGEEFTLGGGVDWAGTVVANGDINPGGGSEIVGSLHSINGSINPDNSWYNIKVVGLHD